MYLGGADDPGGQPRMVAPGAVADLCVLRAPLASALAHPTANQVAATVIGGRVVYEGS
jgi:predicted amidohydrolase YtcJ